MGLIYLTLGLVAVLAIHLSLRWFARANPHYVARMTKWLLAIAAGAVALLLLRLGQPYIAAVFSGILALGALLARHSRWLLRLLPLFPFLSRFRQQTSHTPRRSQDAMSEKEACQILGVSQDASREEIKQAYHELMQKLHPDHGGNEYLATQLNRAKDILLKQKGEGS